MGHFEQVAQLRESLNCGRWRCDFQRKFPTVSVDWERLRGQAEQFSEDPPRSDREHRIALLKRNLLTLLQEEGPDRIHNFVREMEEHARDIRQVLPARRRRFESSETFASAYFQDLEKRAAELHSQARLPESAAVLQEWVHASASSAARLAYSGVLQELGHLEEAEKQLGMLDRWDHRRHYQMAALACQRQEQVQAFGHLLHGLLLNRAVGDALVSLGSNQQPRQGGDYWERHGHLWDEKSRAFFLAVYRLRPVRMRLASLTQAGVHVHEVLSEQTRQYLLKRI